MRRKHAKEFKWTRKNMYHFNEFVVSVIRPHWLGYVWPAFKLALFATLIALRVIYSDYNYFSGSFEREYFLLGIPYWVCEKFRGALNVIEILWLLKHAFRAMREISRLMTAKYLLTPQNVHLRSGSLLNPHWDIVPKKYYLDAHHYVIGSKFLYYVFHVGTAVLSRGNDKIYFRKIRYPENIKLLLYASSFSAKGQEEAKERRLALIEKRENARRNRRMFKSVAAA